MSIDGLMNLGRCPAVQLTPSKCAVIGEHQKCVPLTDEEFEVACRVRDAQANGAGGLHQSDMPEGVYRSLKEKLVIERVPVVQLQSTTTDRLYGEGAAS
jgi:hypothetical protein